MDFSFETYHERDLNALARTKADCTYKCVAGRCVIEKCEVCDIHENFMNCYKQLSDVDKLRVNNKARNIIRRECSGAIAERTIFGTRNQPDIYHVGRWLRRVLLRLLLIAGGIVCIIIGGIYLFYWLYYGVPPW